MIKLFWYWEAIRIGKCDSKRRSIEAKAKIVEAQTSIHPFMVSVNPLQQLL